MFEKKNRVQWVAAAIGLLLLFVLPESVTGRIKGVFKNTLTPVHTFFLHTGRSLKEGADTVRGFGGLAEENRRLAQEVVHLQSRLRFLENLELENRQLKEQLAFRNSQSRHLVAARVAARTISGWWQSVRLDKGARDGVLADRAVISSDGLVGRTAEVSAHTADVLLVSDPACKVSARIARTGSFGLVVGRGVNRKGYPVARMQFVHKDIPIRSGDAVVTSGLGGVFPRDILIGYVEDVHTEDAGLYQYADIIPKAVADLQDVVFIPGDVMEGGVR